MDYDFSHQSPDAGQKRSMVRHYPDASIVSVRGLGAAGGMGRIGRYSGGADQRFPYRFQHRRSSCIHYVNYSRAGQFLGGNAAGQNAEEQLAGRQLKPAGL